jgi:hypothetical protein
VRAGILTFFGEGGPVQLAQAIGWGVAAVLAALTARLRPTAADRVFAAWLGFVALVALLRELDLHEWLHWLGPIHFQSRWLLEAPVSVWWKTAVVAGGAAVGAALVVPPLVLRVPWLALLRRRDRAAWFAAVSFSCLAAGYAIDDVVARRVALGPAVTKPVEETLELLGAVAFLVSVVLERREPVSDRARRLRPRPR